MHKRIPTAAAAVMLGAVLFLSPLQPSKAAEAPKVAVAVVSMDRVMGEAKSVATLDNEFKATLTNQQRQLDNLYAGRLLDDKERAELETLQKLSSPNDSQKKRIAELTKFSNDREAELEKLAKMDKPSDSDRTRRTQLANYLEKQNQRVMQLQQSLGEARQKKQGEVYQRAMETILAAVRAEAQARGVDMVVDRGAVLFSKDTLDITEAVLQRMNGGKVSAKPAGKK